MSAVREFGLGESEQQDLNEYLRERSKRETERLTAVDAGGGAVNTSTGFDWEVALEDFRTQVCLNCERPIVCFTMPAQCLSTPSVQVYLLREARKLRLEGNQYLNQEQWPEARERYQEAYDLLSDGTTILTEGTKVAMGSCRLNLALCHIKEGQFEAARMTCDEVRESIFLCSL